MQSSRFLRMHFDLKGKLRRNGWVREGRLAGGSNWKQSQLQSGIGSLLFLTHSPRQSPYGCQYTIARSDAQGPR